MTTFAQIEKDFLAIDENEHSSIVKYYHENKEYFASIDLNNREIAYKKLWMLSAIINSAYQLKEQKLIRSTAVATIDKFKKYSVKFDYDLSTDPYYKTLLFNIAIDNFENKRFYSAMIYFKSMLQLEKQEYRLVDFFNVSKYRLISKISRIVGALGVALWLAKYILQFIFNFQGLETNYIGISGAILLLIFGLIEFLNKKPSLQQHT